MTDLIRQAYDLGYSHGSKSGHSFKPSKDFILEQRLAYARGFDDGVDDIPLLNQPLNQE
jgi:hypothetical protein